MCQRGQLASGICAALPFPPRGLQCFYSTLDNMDEEKFSFITSFIQIKNHINKLRNAADAFKMLISRTRGDVGEKHVIKNMTNQKLQQLLSPVEEQTDFKNRRKTFSCFGRCWGGMGGGNQETQTLNVLSMQTKINK